MTPMPDFRYWRTVRDEVLRELRSTFGVVVELPGPLWTAVERGVIEGLRRAEWMIANPGGVPYPPDIDNKEPTP